MLEGILKYHIINLNLKVNSNMQETDLYGVFSTFRNTDQWASSGVDECNLYFEVLFKKFIPILIQPIKKS